jgi:16S rRNA (guanine966-N2)-methyltransferase
MRIVAGRFRGHALAGPEGGTRPTSDRVREAIFNILDHGVDGGGADGKRVLDLFAGTGALGFEALSRGARHVLFVEEAAGARSVIRRNAEGLNALGLVKVWRRDATRLGPCAPLPPFDLVFADPPYGKGLGDKALTSLLGGGWLAPGAVLVLEEAERATVTTPEGLALLDRRTYGDTQVLFFRAA